MSNSSKTGVDWSKLAVVTIIILSLFVILGQSGRYMPFARYEHGMNSYNMPGFSIGAVPLINIFIKILWLVLLISIIVTLILAFKKYLIDVDATSAIQLGPLLNSQYNCPKCQQKLNREFKFCPNCKTSLKNQCGNCGKDLLEIWSCCPYCGIEKAEKEV